MQHATSTIAPRGLERAKSERSHQFNLVETHGALRIIYMASSAVGLTGIAVAAQIRQYGREPPGAAAGDFAPGDMGLRVA
jgi:hypothetical protein